MLIDTLHRPDSLADRTVVEVGAVGMGRIGAGFALRVLGRSDRLAILRSRVILGGVQHLLEALQLSGPTRLLSWRFGAQRGRRGATPAPPYRFVQGQRLVTIGGA